MNSLELWGGHECTVNRVEEQWFDQNLRSGHQERLEDLQLFAELGISSLRYPALWERISPDSADRQAFGWTDERLAELRRLGINPILTLCHHGSGPHYTSLIEDSFAPGLARHAAAVAARYPWVRDWTPVNEPLTTARFSALYGLWYPHAKDERLLWTALLNEIDATRLAMREIRKVNPAARLIQTDDLGFCHATEPLQFDADYQNERRWLGWDLLCGMVVPGHPLWERIAGHGFAARLEAIAADPCPPDVIGINHYLSSERLMDHRVDLYPHRSLADRTVALCGGVPKIDVDAIRHREEGVLGLPALLRQAWQRYGRSIAITECHLGATREEQVRWFVEVWRGAEALRSEGVDLCAVTAWSLLGAYDWNGMVTRVAGHYESGVFDVRSGTPRPTLLARVLKDLAEGRDPQHPVLAESGWWRRRSRLVHSPSGREPRFELSPDDGAEGLLILHDGGDLARLVVRACEVRGLAYRRGEAPEQALAAPRRPWALVDARRDAAGLGEFCRAAGLRWARISTGLDGLGGAACDAGLTLRTGPLFMPWDAEARAVALLDALDAGAAVQADAGRPWTGVYGPDAVDLLLDLLLDGVANGVDARGGERLSELDFARALARVADRDPALVVAAGTPPPRPLFAWPARPGWLPTLESTLERFVREARLARADGLGARRSDEDLRLEAAE